MNTAANSATPRSTFKQGAVVATLAATLMAAMPAGVTTASAGDRNWQSGGYGHVERCGPYGRPCRGPGRPQVRYESNNNGDVLGAAVLGIIGGAIIAGALSNASRNQPIYDAPTYAQPTYRQPTYIEPVHPRYRAPEPVYVAPHAYPPAPSRPQVITYGGAIEPLSQEWYDWCDSRYRSFNPQRGTYRGYDGQDHFCVPK